MIPLRVYLKNFLCHQEQEFCFDGQPVWLLHGPNGLGKSAVFDAIVYALFGEHNRYEGVTNEARELIRQGETSMRVEFDFEYQNNHYRIWRTRTRGGTGNPRQGVLELRDGQLPRPVRDVNAVREVDKWVTGTLGLEYRAFVSAVLLRQGSAERLVNTDASDRREFYRGIIDLGPYVALHVAIAEARTGLGRDVRLLRGQVERMPDVTEEVIASATSDRDRAVETAEGARANEAAWRERLGDARVWEELNATCRSLQGQLAATRDRAARASELERAVARLRELRDWVPALARIVDCRRRAEAARAEVEGLTDEHHEAVAARATADSALAGVRQSIARSREVLAENGRRFTTADADRQRLEGEISRAENAADLHQQLREARGRLFPSDLDEHLRLAETAVVEAQMAREAWPLLEAIHNARESFRQAAECAELAVAALAGHSTELLRLREVEAAAVRRAGDAKNRAEIAGRDLAGAEWGLVAARDRLTRFTSVAEAQVCSECGQAIDADHARREHSRLEQQCVEAEVERDRLRGVEHRAATAAAEAHVAVQGSEEARREAEAARHGAVRDQTEAARRANEARADFFNALERLYVGLSSRVGRIEDIGFPTQADLTVIHTTGNELSRRARARDQVRAQCQERDNTAEQIRTLEQAVGAVGAPADVTVARTVLDEVRQTLDGLNHELAAEQQRLNGADQREAELTDRVREAANRVSDLGTRLAVVRERAETAERDLAAASATLPDRVTELDPAELADELNGLESAGVENDYNALAGDRARQEEWEGNLAETQARIERLPPEARRPVIDVQTEVDRAAQAAKEAVETRQSAQDRLATLLRQRDDRATTQQTLIATERSYALHDRLAGLLGGEGIQMDIVRQADRSVLATASQVVEHVSRGELRLELPDAAGAQANGLFVRRRGWPEPIPVRNLSSGQRCRIAISLALAVCRYACREAHPLQSLIIDEGFANLDREGRMAMIDFIYGSVADGALLRRIILVSHHEDIAAAFPVQYRFSNENGATTVSRCLPA